MRRLAIGANVQTAVLIVEGGIDQNWRLADVHAVLSKHAQHGRNPAFNCTCPMAKLNHRGIQPDPLTIRGLYSLVPAPALPNDGGGGHIPGLQGMHKRLALPVDEHRPQGPDLFRH